MPASAATKTYNTRRVLIVDSKRFSDEMARHGATTDERIALLLETDRTTVGRIRRGTTLPSNGFLAACCDAGVNFLSFLTVQRRDDAERAA